MYFSSFGVSLLYFIHGRKVCKYLIGPGKSWFFIKLDESVCYCFKKLWRDPGGSTHSHPMDGEPETPGMLRHRAGHWAPLTQLCSSEQIPPRFQGSDSSAVVVCHGSMWHIVGLPSMEAIFKLEGWVLTEQGRKRNTEIRKWSCQLLLAQMHVPIRH